MKYTYFKIRIESEEKPNTQERLILLNKFRKEIDKVVPDGMKVTLIGEATNDEIMEALRNGEN